MDASVPDGRGDVPSWPVAGQRNARYLRSDGAYLYWLADEAAKSALKRCEKRDCGGTETVVARFPFTGPIVGFEIRGDTLYAVSQYAILRCQLDDCSAIETVVALGEAAPPKAAAFDDAKVYFSHGAIAKVFSCPLDGCKQPATVVAGTLAVELVVDATHLYWIAPDTLELGSPISIMSAPKDGSAAPKVIATRQNQAASLVVQDGFVYWATSYTLGGLARCPAAGCGGSEPEVLAERQYFPQFVSLDGHTLFWMNGPGGQNMAMSLDRPVQLLTCRLPDCATSTEVLDEGRGGGFGARIRSPGTLSGIPALAPREMVVDSDAIFWIGDIVNVVPPSLADLQVDGAIRRTERRR